VACAVALRSELRPTASGRWSRFTLGCGLSLRSGISWCNPLPTEMWESSGLGSSLGAGDSRTGAVVLEI
jgi:hypothetical protein